MTLTRKIRATQVALLATGAVLGNAASAQSVTLYGLVDTNIEYVNNQSRTGATVPAGPASSRVAMLTGGIGGSRWGLRGVEDLGNGIKGVFVLESGFNSDDGKSANSGRLFGRQAYVGFDSRFGKITFGRQYTSIFDVLANFQAGFYQPQYEPVVAYLGRYYREDNVIKYGGTFGPLEVAAHWSFGVDTAAPATAGEVPGSIRSGAAFGGAASYTAGAFGVGVAYDEVDAPAAVGGAPGRAKRAAVSGKYADGNVRLVAGYRWGRSTSGTDVELLRDNYYWVGGTYAFTPQLESTLAYYYDDVRQVANPVNSVALGNIKNPWQVMFTTKYFFTKRTSLYLATAYSKNSGLNFDTSVGGLGTGYYLGAGKNSQFAVALGMRHIF